MSRIRIKFCGMTRVEDTVAAARLGVDAIGFVFVRRSPRFLEPAAARAIAAALPPLVTVVALFMDDEVAWVREVERVLRPHWLQFHGSETDTFCAAFDTPHVKAVAMDSRDDVRACLDAHPRARGFVLDGHATGAQGGRGQAFDWSRIPRDIERPVILAGGLTADNVTAAIDRVRPWAVDVSSGIESAPGIKSLDRMRAFIHAARSSQA